MIALSLLFIQAYAQESDAESDDESSTEREWHLIIHNQTNVPLAFVCTSTQGAIKAAHIPARYSFANEYFNAYWFFAEPGKRSTSEEVVWSCRVSESQKEVHGDYGSSITYAKVEAVATSYSHVEFRNPVVVPNNSPINHRPIDNPITKMTITTRPVYIYENGSLPPASVLTIE